MGGFPVLAGFVSIVVWHLSMLCVGTAVVVNIHHYDENYKNEIVEKIVQSKFVRRLGLIPKRQKQVITEQHEDLLKETDMSTKTSTNIDQLTVQLMQIMNPKPEVKATMWKTFAYFRSILFLHTYAFAGIQSCQILCKTLSLNLKSTCPQGLLVTRYSGLMRQKLLNIHQFIL